METLNVDQTLRYKTLKLNRQYKKSNFGEKKTQNKTKQIGK